MATLISCTSGSWTESSTWALCNSTAELDSEAGNNNLTTTYRYSSAFTPGAITVDGIALKLCYRDATPGSNTLTVCIGQGGTPVTGTEVTINQSDLDYTSTTPTTVCNQSYGWYFFKFSGSIALLGATDYTVGIKVSSSSNLPGFYTNGTTYNWSRQLRTTTTQASSAGDKLYVIGEHTGAGTGNDITVKMNNTDSSTDYGTGSTSLPSLGVGKRGTLDWKYDGTTALRLSGLFWIWSGGTVNIGTETNPIGASYTSTLEFDCASAGDFGLIKGSGGKLIIQGNPLSYDRAYLAANSTTGESIIYTDVSTGWKNGDTIVIAPTERTYSQYEVKTLNGDASGSTITITGTLSYNHSGSAPRIGEVINLTRNTRITALNTAYNAYMLFYMHNDSNGSVNIDWGQFSELGNATTGNKYGLYLSGSVANTNINRSSFAYCYSVNCASDFSNFTISNTVHHSGSSSYTSYFYYPQTTNQDFNITNNWFIGAANSNATFFVDLRTLSGSFTYNNICGCQGYGIGIADTGYATPIGTFSDNTSHTNGQYGLYSANTSLFCGGTIKNLTLWCNGGWGFYLGPQSFNNITFDNINVYGNTNLNVYMQGLYDVKFIGGNIHSLSDYTTSYGLGFGGGCMNVSFIGTNIGGSATGKIDHSSNELGDALKGVHTNISFHNCTWGAANRIGGVVTYSPQTKVAIQFSKDNGIEGSDFTYIKSGVLAHDSSNGVGGGDCLKISPSGNTYYCDTSDYLDILPMFQCPAQDGVSRNVYIKLKKTADLDSTNVSISIYQNGTLVDGWDDCIGTLSSSDYIEYALNYTPTEDGILDMAIRLNGTVGSLYVDEFRWT